MSDGPASKVIDELMAAAPQLVAEGLAFHMAVADRLGLSLADLRYLQRITEGETLTAGEIAARTGLTTGAVTRMVDRLEQAGYVQRVRDTTDRRRVAVIPDTAAMARVGSMYGGMAAAWRTALTDYSEEQLTVILDLFQRMRQLTRQETDRLR